MVPKMRQSQSGRPSLPYLVQRVAEEFGVAAVQPTRASAPSYEGAIQEARWAMERSRLRLADDGRSTAAKTLATGEESR